MSGKIKYKIDKRLPEGKENWSGVINIIAFETKTASPVTINHTVTTE